MKEEQDDLKKQPLKPIFIEKCVTHPLSFISDSYAPNVCLGKNSNIFNAPVNKMWA